MKHTNRPFQDTLSIVPGFAFALALAIPAWFAGKLLPAVGGAVFALVLGILVGSFRKPSACIPGIRFTGKKVLQYAIILLGFDMQINEALKIGARSLIVMAFTLTAGFIATVAFARLFRVGKKQAILVGVGTCVCGGSAIAATAPVIGASDEDVARSISTIFLFNVVAVFLFPALGRALMLSDAGFGLWAGTAINDTSSVVAAASSWGGAPGEGSALAIATVVKLTRTLLIVPITVGLSVGFGRETRRSTSAVELARVFPWFVLYFVAATLVNSFVPLPAGLSPSLASAGKFLIVVAMVAIGLSTDVRSLVAGGKGPIALALGCWVAISAVSLAVQGLTGGF
jgi:uncharacterized integral membrane protein (TIGR00698 family)